MSDVRHSTTLLPPSPFPSQRPLPSPLLLLLHLPPFPAPLPFPSPPHVLLHFPPQPSAAWWSASTVPPLPILLPYPSWLSLSPWLSSGHDRLPASSTAGGGTGVFLSRPPSRPGGRRDSVPFGSL
ncbi:hypothetical protein GG344DRAFT_81415 [Lentinula edodes]|nr:hypothetical protein GG344DRAFT_81415 [Lentinula edodes]